MLELIKMKSLILASLLGLALSIPLHDLMDPEHDEHWETFKKTYQKEYKSEIEHNLRRVMWENNLKYVQEHNIKADMGLSKYWLGINEHADKTDEEFTTMRGYAVPEMRNGSTYLSPSYLVAPDEVDWRKEGYVTPVKNQGHCGSCWAFSATGSLEGQHFKKSGTLVSLSEQDLVDCSTKLGNHGCKGGSFVLAFEYIKMNSGIDTEQSYPYEMKDATCRFKKNDIGATDTGFTQIPKGDEDALREAVASVGPISVAIDAGHKDFQLYKKGVYTSQECSNKKLDHGVLAVGYGELDGEKYWLVKNSWGESWGDEGYIMMRRDWENMCGIATAAAYPLV